MVLIIIMLLRNFEVGGGGVYKKSCKIEFKEKKNKNLLLFVSTREAAALDNTSSGVSMSSIAD